MPSRWSFPNPFLRNHCVAVAWAHLAGLDGAGAVELAKAARRTRRPFDAQDPENGGVWRPRRDDGHLLNAHGSSFDTTQPANVEAWARLAGLEVVPGTAARFFTGRSRTSGDAPSVTAARFAREHRRGRWFVRVRGHAFAVIEGVPHGSWEQRSRVDFAVQVRRPGARVEAPAAAKPAVKVVDWVRAAFALKLTDAQIVFKAERELNHLRDPRNSVRGYLRARRAGREV